MSNSTCFSPKAPQEGPPLFQHGNIVFQAHDVGWIVTGFFTTVATITSLWLVNKHLQWYTNKREQRYIVRILFLVPIYALISLASYLFWNHSTPLLLIRDCYESTVLTAFFYLLLTYLSPSPDEQKAIFLKVGLSRQVDREAKRKGEKVRKWVIPLSFIKAKPEDGMYFLQMMKWGVLQYCVIRPTTTLAAVILNYFGWYCNDSFSPRWGHVYITIVVSVSVSIAMYCLIQLYIPIAGHLAPHKPILKLFAVKAVVFLTFWQATLLSVLSMFGLIKDTQYMTADDINTGWSAIIETFEMMLFAFLHIRAFSYKPYRPPYQQDLTNFSPPTRTPRLRSLGHAFDFRETFREIWAGFIYIADRMRGVEPRVDVGARRIAMMEDAFGRARLKNTERAREKSLGKVVEVRKKVNVDVDVGGERQWLGLGDDYAYGLGYATRREKSDGLGEAIEKELDKRGVRLRDADIDRGLRRMDDVDPEQIRRHSRRSQRTSWWRNMYNHLSQSGADATDERFTQAMRRNSSTRHRTRHVDHTSLLYEYDDDPPPSIIHAYRSNRQSQDSRNLDDVTNMRDVSKPDIPIAQYTIHVQEPTDVLIPPPTSKPRSAHVRGTSNSSSTPCPPADRPDSLLARVFPHGSPAMSSTELGSVSSASNHKPRTRPHTANPHLMTTSSVIITPGNDPGRALMSSPAHLQVPVEHTSEKDHDTDPRAHQLLLQPTSVEPDLIPPPVPPKSSSHGSERSPKRHESHPPPDEHPSRSSHHRESAGHHASRPTPPSSLQSSLSDTTRAVPQPTDHTNDIFDPMVLYMAGDNTRQMRTRFEPTARLASSARSYPATSHAPPRIQGHSPRSHFRLNAVSPSYHVAEIRQQPVVAADPIPQPPGLPRSTYTRPPTGARRHRRLSAPSEIAPQFVRIPTAAHSRTGYQSRHSMDNANTRQLTVPAPLAPPPPSSQWRLSQDMHHARYPNRRGSDLAHLPLSSGALASSTSRYDLSGQYHNSKYITNLLPSAEV